MNYSEHLRGGGHVLYMGGRRWVLANDIELQLMLSLHRANKAPMEIELKLDVDPMTFLAALGHLSEIGAERVTLFHATRQGEGPWLIAYVYVDGRRHVRATTDNWKGRSMDAQAIDLARKLEQLVPSGDEGDHPF